MEIYFTKEEKQEMWHLCEKIKPETVSYVIEDNNLNIHSDSSIKSGNICNIFHFVQVLIVTTWFQFVKKLLWVPMGSQIRNLWPRWPSPNVLACLEIF